MSVSVQLVPGNLPPNPCYASEQARLNAYIGVTSASIPSGGTFLVQSAAPGPEDRDKIWIQVDGSGRIVGVFAFSNGQWQTINPTTPYLIPGEFREYDPGLYTPVAPWFPCDGSVVGVPDRRGTFGVCTGQGVAPASRTYTNPDGTIVTVTDPRTNFAPGAKGGEEQHVIIQAELPNLNLSPVVVAPGSGAYGLTGGTSAPGYAASVSTGGTFTGHNNLPPYYAAAVMQWRPDLA